MSNTIRPICIVCMSLSNHSWREALRSQIATFTFLHIFVCMLNLIYVNIYQNMCFTGCVSDMNEDICIGDSLYWVQMCYIACSEAYECILSGEIDETASANSWKQKKWCQRYCSWGSGLDCSQGSVVLSEHLDVYIRSYAFY